MKLLKFLFGICDHKWENIDHGNLYRANSRAKDKPVYGKYYVQQCTKCGELRLIKLLFNDEEE